MEKGLKKNKKYEYESEDKIEDLKMRKSVWRKMNMGDWKIDKMKNERNNKRKKSKEYVVKVNWMKVYVIMRVNKDGKF